MFLVRVTRCNPETFSVDLVLGDWDRNGSPSRGSSHDSRKRGYETFCFQDVGLDLLNFRNIE